MEYTGRSAPGYYEHRILLCPKLSYGRQRRDAVRREGLFRHGNARWLRVLEGARFANCEVLALVSASGRAQSGKKGELAIVTAEMRFLMSGPFVEGFSSRQGRSRRHSDF
jgi:hypothetical protein